MRKQFFVCDRPLFAGLEIFHSHLRPFVAENDGKARAALLGQSELARHFRRRQGVIDTVSAIAQLLQDAEGLPDQERREPKGWLIDQHQLRIEQETARDFELLLFAARQRGGLLG